MPLGVRHMATVDRHVTDRPAIRLKQEQAKRVGADHICVAVDTKVTIPF